jgi:hypothetical protein
MTTYSSVMRGVPTVLIDGLTALNASGKRVIPSSFTKHKLTIKGSVGSPISAGAIQPETSEDITYTGVWNPLGGGPITVVDSAEIEYNFEGILSCIQARITTALVGGNVTVIYVGS